MAKEIAKAERNAILMEAAGRTFELDAKIASVKTVERTSANGKPQVFGIFFGAPFGVPEYGATSALYFTEEQLPMVADYFGVAATKAADPDTLAELINSMIRSGEISRSAIIVYEGHNEGDRYITNGEIKVYDQTGFQVKSIMTTTGNVFANAFATKKAEALVTKQNSLSAQLRAKAKVVVKLTEEEEEELKQLEELASKGKLNKTDKVKYDELSAKAAVI